jgi:hypothetical protein
LGQPLTVPDGGLIDNVPTLCDKYNGKEPYQRTGRGMLNDLRHAEKITSAYD